MVDPRAGNPSQTRRGGVWKNTRAQPTLGVPPGAVAAHPGAMGELTVIRYTAPFAGRFSAQLAVLVGDIGATEVTLRVAGALVHTSRGAATFSQPATALAIGGTIELRVDGLGDWTSDNTRSPSRSPASPTDVESRRARCAHARWPCAREPTSRSATV